MQTDRPPRAGAGLRPGQGTSRLTDPPWWPLPGELPFSVAELSGGCVGSRDDKLETSPAHLAFVQWGEARSGASPCSSQAPQDSGNKGGLSLPKSHLGSQEQRQMWDQKSCALPSPGGKLLR